jgi:selenophosphate synthase
MLFDPQTSGGLLVALDPAAARAYLDAMAAAGRSAAHVGDVVVGSGITLEA